MIADPTDLLNEIARPPSATVSPFDDREEVAAAAARLSPGRAARLDIHGRLIGAIRHDALLKTLEEAASVDIQMMVGAGREERALSWRRNSRCASACRGCRSTSRPLSRGGRVGLFEARSRSSRRSRCSCPSSRANPATRARRPWRSRCAGSRCAASRRDPGSVRAVQGDLRRDRQRASRSRSRQGSACSFGAAARGSRS